MATFTEITLCAVPYSEHTLIPLILTGDGTAVHPSNPSHIRSWCRKLAGTRPVWALE